MLEILQFYVDSFWGWLGITIGLGIIIQGVVEFAISIFKRGNNV